MLWKVTFSTVQSKHPLFERKLRSSPVASPNSNITADRAEVTENDFSASVRYGAHTDYQGFTILRPDKNDWHPVDVPRGDSEGSVQVLAGGLEVFHRASGQWMQVRIPQHLNALVINAGTTCTTFQVVFR